MGGFAFVFGFLMTCFGCVLMSAAGGNVAVGNIGDAVTLAGAIVCGSGVIDHAIESAANTRKQKGDSASEES